jgi:TorA maturation chaperone TorD
VNDEPASWSDVAELRQGLYRFFAGALLPPDPDRLESLRAATATLAACDVDLFAFGPAWRAAAAVLAATPPAELDAAYAALFVSPAGSGTCPPLESRYGAPPGGAPFVDGELRREYSELGLGLRPRLEVPSDHVSVQLEIMSCLCHEEAHAWADERARVAVARLLRQREFLDRHLGRWVPAWAADVRRETGGPWRSVVDAAAAFVQHDRDLVGALTHLEPAGT